MLFLFISFFSHCAASLIVCESVLGWKKKSAYVLTYIFIPDSLQNALKNV